MAIFCIAGMSGVGKSTIAKEISKMMGLPLVISCTTRPRRPNENDGIDYHFITDKVYDFLLSENKLVAKESFNVVDGEVWKYGFVSNELLRNKHCLTVINPKGITDLKNDGIENVVSILIDVDEKERMERIMKRNDNQKAAEIKRRTIKDREMFDQYNFDYVVNNDTIENSLKTITEIIEKEKDKQNYKELSSWCAERMKRQNI